ncbi:transferase [Aureococcus anophagefferens]|nr:transferase [Aureococcus anophagefferens]
MSCSGGGGPVSRSVWSLGAAEGSGASVGSSDGQELGGGTGLADGAGRGAGPAPACVKKPWGVGSKVAAPVFGGPSTSPPLGVSIKKTSTMGFVGALLAAGAAAVDFPRCPVATPSDSYPAFPFKAFSAAYVEESLARPVDWRARGAVTPCKSQGAQGDCGAIAAPVSRIGIDADVFKNLDDDHHITPDRCGNFTAIDHSLGIVGYNATADKGAYWIVKNSWGDAWADHGFLYVARGVGCGNIFGSGGHVYTYGDPSFYYDA